MSIPKSTERKGTAKKEQTAEIRCLDSHKKPTHLGVFGSQNNKKKIQNYIIKSLNTTHPRITNLFQATR